MAYRSACQACGDSAWERAVAVAWPPGPWPLPLAVAWPPGPWPPADVPLPGPALPGSLEAGLAVPGPPGAGLAVPESPGAGLAVPGPWSP